MAQFNVNLAFNADTGKAKTQIQELQSLLSKIAYSGTSTGTDKLENDLHQAAAAAKELQFHLNNAFNASTGNFDLSMLDRSLKASGSNVTDLSAKLLSAGATGQQAFVKLAQSISLADQPMFRISKRMQDFAVTMKNTVKWQLSSSMLHGFMGAVQSAYGYAKDLNRSLNDIRIVTGYNTDKMAEFAEQANKAAKALSTTTTDYTNASLIYFQQGLNDAEVAARTDITIKMANAVGQSAEVISEQLTAVWNNFADGSKSLEYYADVMAALGAATASSSDEIAEGLSKFSAVAGTVGLSYEYATAALATLTSNTRESADVVGNSLKTLFARIQGLQLGETLEDGTTLNKYSEALQKVGISIYDANGGLKDMDNILDEMASRWSALSDTQQVALAQTVAGVRQYNQLIALMENWNNGDNDSMMANLSTIEGSEGALQKQADIYAQSWEAAEKRVQAAAEGIYQSLLDDEFFIKLTNGFANVLGGLDAFIEGAGGLKSILVGIGGIVLSTFANRIPEALKTFKYNLDLVTKGSGEVYQKMQKELRDSSDKAFSTQYNWNDKEKQFKATPGIDKNSSQGYAIEQANELTSARNKLAVVTDKMSNSERQAAESTIKEIENEQQAVVALKEKNEALQKSIELQKKKSTSKDSQGASRKESRNLGDLQTDILMDMEEQSRAMAQIEEQIKNNQPVSNEQYEQYDLAEHLIPQYQKLSQAVSEFHSNYQDVAISMQGMQDATGRSMLEAFIGPDFDQTKQQVLEFPSAFQAAFSSLKDQIIGDNALDLSESMNIDAVHKELTALSASIDPVIQEATGLDKAFEQALQANSAEDMVKAITKLDGKLQDCKIEGADFEKVLRKLYGSKNIDQLIADVDKLELGLGEAESRAAALAKKLKDFNPQHVVRMSEAFGALGGFAGSAASIVTSLGSAVQALANPDLSGWEKFTAVLSSIGMLIPSIMSSMSSYATMVAFLNTEMTKQAVIEGKSAIVKAGLTVWNFALAESTEELTEENTQNTLSIIANELAEKGNIATTAAAAIVKAAYDRVKASGNKVTAQAIILNILENATVDQSNKKLSLKIVLLTIIKALTGDWASIVKVLIGALVVLAGVGLVKWLENVIVTQKEANQAMADANQAYKDQQSTVNNLKNELSSLQDRIEELQALDTLSLVEQQELDLLLSQEASLSRQLAIEEQILETKKQQAALEFEKNGGTGSGWSISAPKGKTYVDTAAVQKDSSYEPGQNPYTSGGGYMMNTANSYNSYAAGVQARENQAVVDKYTMTSDEYYDKVIKPLEDAAAAGKELTEEETAKVQGYYDDLAETEAARQKWYLDNADAIKTYREGFANWLDVNKDATPEEIEEKMRPIIEADKALYGDDYEKEVYGSKNVERQLGLENLNIDQQLLDDFTADKDIDMTGEQLAGQFSEGFKRYLYQNGIIPEDYAQWLIDKGNTLISGVTKNLEVTGEDGDGVTLEELQQDGRWQEGDLELLAQIRITNEDDIDSIFDKIRNIEATQFDLGGWKKNYSEILKIIEGLNPGDVISAEDYALLGEEYQKYFTVQADGTAILTGKAEDLLNLVNGIEIQKLIDNITTRSALIQETGKEQIVSSSGSGAQMSFTAAHAQATEGTLSGSFYADYINTVNEALNTNYTSVEEAAAGWNNYVAGLESSSAVLAQTATSQDQLNQYLQQGLITQEQYNQNFAGATIKEATDLDIDVDELMEYAEYLHEVEGMTEELALKAALAQKKQGKAVEDLTDNYEDYAKVLKKAKLDPTIKGTEEYSKAIMGLRKDLSLLTGLSEDTFDEDFINSPEVQKALEDVANGVDGAIERVQALAAMDLLKDREQFIIKAGVEVDQEKFSALTNQIAELNNMDIEVGTRINDAPALDQLANLVNASGMTASQMQEFFNALGWEPEIEWVEADADTVANMHSLGYQEYGVLNPDGSMSIHSVPLDGDMSQHSGQKIMIPKIKTSGQGGGYTKIDPPGGGGGSSNKGGGGGGSKKHAEKKDTGDRTRYHTIQNQLEDLQDAYDNVSNAADRAFGKNKLDLMDKQGAALDNLINKQKEYVDALSADVPVDKAVMDAYYDKVIGGPAMEFDKDGNIANYDEIEAAMHAKYNEMADKYTDDSTEWQQFEKQYEQMEKYIEDYEKYYDDLRDAEAEYQDLINQRIDLQLQKVQYKVELELDVENDEMELIQYQLSLIEDDAFKSAEAITLLTKQAESLYDQIQVNKQGLNDTLALSLDAAEIASVMSGDLSVLKDKSFTEDQIGAIRDYRDSLISLNEEFNEVRKSIEEQVMATFDAWQEKLERGSDALEHYGSILESYQNIVDIVGADTLGISSKFMADLSQAKVSNSIDQLEAAKSSYEAVAAAQKEAQEALAAAQAAEDDASISMWEETLITLNEEAQAASEELMAAWEEALSGIVEAFDMAVDRAVQDFNDAIYSLGGVEGLLDAFQNAQETSDLMLEDYKQIYELSKLSRDINNSIDDTDSLAGKQKLKKLLGEINKLQEEGVEMSQYDLEYLQAEYNLRLAEIELEEAQNAKNTVRLQKDNEGNWSYVYTQNTDAVDAAQQKYEDALYSMQDLSSNYIDEMSEQLINTSQEMAEALAALRVEDFASIDEYYAEVERVQAQYQEEIAMQESELQKAIDNNKELYDQDWTNYHNATGYKISDTENFVTSFKDSLLGTLLDSESDAANFTSILGQATASLTTNLMEAAATYYQNLDNAMEAAGTTTEGFAEDTQANIEAIVAASESGAAAVDAMATEMTQAFGAVADSVTSWQETYGIAMQAVMDSNVKVIESFNAMLSALAIDEGSVTVKYDIASAPEADPEQFDTGGYTGEWGNKGKIAVVHEKELILNEDDTTNFLSAIQVTRAMLETIDLNAKQASLGMGSLIASTVKDEAVQTLEQEVHITAEFPNVSDHNEVEEALRNLMNTASQYANRK